MDYVIYFLLPLLIAFIGARILRQRYRIFFIGGLAFFAAWVIDQTITGTAAAVFGWKETSVLFGLVASLSAGVFEESARYVVFRHLPAFRGNRNWRSAVTYTFGHHGAETVIVGLSLLLTYVVVTYKPDALSDPQMLERARAAVALGAGPRIYNASERLIVGFLIHACFSSVVMLSVLLAQRRLLLVAMGWHFVHDMIGFNLHRLSDHWLVSKAWIAFILVVYTIILTRLCRRLGAGQDSTTNRPPPLIAPAG